MGMLHAKVISELVLPAVQWQSLPDYVFGDTFKLMYPFLPL